MGVAAVNKKSYNSTAAASSAISSQVFSANNCRIFRCSIENGGENEKEVVDSSEEKSVRSHRRQKGSGRGMALPGSLDLLTIPGVGPRNLRKLVEKGIGGVAELKQLYKDKVFARAVHEANWMNEMEISIYDSWFDPVVSSLPGLIPDGFIYLRASPDTCHKRLLLRKIAEESGVMLEYMYDLYEKHEIWLSHSKVEIMGFYLSISFPRKRIAHYILI